MGNTCAAYWMPPIAVIAPTMIANGGSDSKGMCSVFFFSCVVPNKIFEEEQKERKRKRKRKKTNVCLFVFFLSDEYNLFKHHHEE